MLIKSLPKEERPLEKAVSRGIGALSNTELLGIIIHTGTRNSSALHLAEDLLGRIGGLAALGSVTMEELTEISGIGQAKACTVLAAVELGKRIAGSAPAARPRINGPGDVAEMLMETLRYERKEHFIAVLLNARSEVITVDYVSLGELDSTIVHPREVFLKAVRKSAAYVILVHNHPSGDPEPSDEDICTTERLRKCGELMGIRVLDHIVIGDGRYTSLKDLNLIE
ncbi:MAG: DNA repair protein RadC [Eubacterium sp.]|nr:DNA repair protein RadC [Eubacterium sp.]